MSRMIKTLIITLGGAASIVIPLMTKADPLATLVGVALISVVMLWAAGNRSDVLHYATAFVFIPLIFDLPGVHVGLWAFANPGFFGVPFWLPFVYGNGSVFVNHFRKFA